MCRCLHTDTFLLHQLRFSFFVLFFPLVDFGGAELNFPAPVPLSEAFRDSNSTRADCLSPPPPHRRRRRPQTVIKCLISAGTVRGGGAMMLLSLGGTPAERATPACDLYFLLSAPTSQIAKITHLFKKKKRRYRLMLG